MRLSPALELQRPGPTPFREVGSIAPEWTLVRKEMRQKSSLVLHQGYKVNNLEGKTTKTAVVRRLTQFHSLVQTLANAKKPLQASPKRLGLDHKPSSSLA